LENYKYQGTPYNPTFRILKHPRYHFSLSLIILFQSSNSSIFALTLHSFRENFLYHQPIFDQLSRYLGLFDVNKAF